MVATPRMPAARTGAMVAIGGSGWPSSRSSRPGIQATSPTAMSGIASMVAMTPWSPVRALREIWRSSGLVGGMAGDATRRRTAGLHSRCTPYNRYYVNLRPMWIVEKDRDNSLLAGYWRQTGRQRVPLRRPNERVELRLTHTKPTRQRGLDRVRATHPRQRREQCPQAEALRPRRKARQRLRPQGVA